ncbi:MAG: hypothetical protein FJY97_13970 [candidate division Zixibacteria bacterium]|nr:hypothetical protein [candidate division Zixibacteria bacterium]
MSDTLILWIDAALTLMILSFLYRDNAFYKFAEHLFVGVSAAYWMVVGFWDHLVPNLLGKLFPSLMSGVVPVANGQAAEWHYLIPAVFGLLLLTRLVDRWAWLSRWSLAFIVGGSAGFNLPRFLDSDFITQVQSTMVPLLVFDTGGALLVGASLSHLVLVAGVICGLVYFFFSLEHDGITGKVSRLGIYVLMVTFGAAFGYTVMARISLLIGRMDSLGNWLSSMGL